MDDTVISDDAIDVLLTGEIRMPTCEECCFWFLGCLYGRETWKDISTNPPLRFLSPNDKGGFDRMRCDKFEWRPESSRGNFIEN